MLVLDAMLWYATTLRTRTKNGHLQGLSQGLVKEWFNGFQNTPPRQGKNQTPTLRLEGKGLQSNMERDGVWPLKRRWRLRASVRVVFLMHGGDGTGP